MFKQSQRLLLYIIEDVGLRVYLVVFVIIVVGLGWGYYALSPYNQGIVSSSGISSNINFWEGLYFSIVTVSSLGYGDNFPIGISKIFACFEVLFGLTFMGFLIAKITSRRLSHHVQRIFASDAQKRLNEFSLGFESLYHDLKRDMRALSNLYQSTPARGEVAEGDRASVLSPFNNTISILHTMSSNLYEYMAFEVEHGAYFTIVSGEVLQNLATTLDKTLFTLGQLFISLSEQVRTEILDLRVRQSVAESLGKHRLICEFVFHHCRDQSILNIFARVRETCNNIPAGYFEVSPVPLEVEQPDQKLRGSNEPQS